MNAHPVSQAKGTAISSVTLAYDKDPVRWLILLTTPRCSTEVIQKCVRWGARTTVGAHGPLVHVLR
jgi:formate dehydrogenase assembly factor FdhD